MIGQIGLGGSSGAIHYSPDSILISRIHLGSDSQRPNEVFGSRRRSSYRFKEYLGKEALHQTVRRVARKGKVEEGVF